MAALKFKTEVLWAQLEAIERGDTQPEAAGVNRPRLVDGARLQYDDVREEHLLLDPGGRRAPERDGGARARAVRRRALASRRSPPRSRSATPAPTSTDDVRELLGGMVAARAGGRCRRLGPTRSSRSSPTVPAALPVLLEPGRHRRRALPRASSRPSTGPASSARRGRSASLQLALTGGEPMVRRDLDELVAAARAAGPVLDARHRRHALHARARRAAEGGRARPRPGLDPEPRPGGERPDRRHPLVREEDRGRARGARARASRSRSTASCTARTSTGSRRSSRSPRSSTRSGSSSRTRSTTGGPSLNQQALMPTREQLERGEEAVQRFRERVGPRITVLWVLPGLLRGPAEAVHGRLGADDDRGRARTARRCPCQAAATIPGLEFPNVREHSLDWIWNESDAFTRFRGTDWMQEPCRVVPARSPGGGLRRLPLPGAAAHRRRRGDRSRSAGSRRTTTSSSRPARRRRPTSSSTAR